MPTSLRLTLLEEYKRHFVEDCWAGPAVMEMLQGVNATTAAARPIADAHTIWEIVLHITAWVEGVYERLEGVSICIEGEKDWPPQGASEAEWQAALEKLQTAYKRLTGRVSKLKEDELTQMAPTGKFTRSELLHGIIQHNMYHAGQIALLKKAAKS